MDENFNSLPRPSHKRGRSRTKSKAISFRSGKSSRQSSRRRSKSRNGSKSRDVDKSLGGVDIRTSHSVSRMNNIDEGSLISSATASTGSTESMVVYHIKNTLNNPEDRTLHGFDPRPGPRNGRPFQYYYLPN